MRRRLEGAVAALAAGALAASGLLWQHEGAATPRNVGSLDAIANHHREPRWPGEREKPRVSGVEVHSARLADVGSTPRGPRPLWIRIESIDVDAPIVLVGVAGGTTEVPQDVDEIGWYRFGPAPGRPGSAVLLGHVDSGTQGPGAFFRLREVEPGDLVSVGFSDDSTRRFDVVARREYLKERLPENVFSRTGPPVLALVTCGGSFDVTTLRYTHNVVVYATPLGGGGDAERRSA